MKPMLHTNSGRITRATLFHCGKMYVTTLRMHGMLLHGQRWKQTVRYRKLLDVLDVY